MQSWDDVEQFLIDEARRDLERGDEMARPCLVAFRGESPRFVAFLRDFVKGEYHAPIVELLALAAPLDADRLALGMTARAWSLEDPVVPVTQDGDLRQRVLMIERADATSGTSQSTSVLIPFEDPRPGESIRWGERKVLGACEGWLSAVLGVAVTAPQRQVLRVPDRGIAAQAMRLDMLGHLLAFAPDVMLRLQSAEMTEADARGAGLPWPLPGSDALPRAPRSVRRSTGSEPSRPSAGRPRRQHRGNVRGRR
jgi:hypothetical protein